MIKKIYDFVPNDIEPVGFESGVLYNIDANACIRQEGKRDHSSMRMAVCVQGLVNRGFKKHNTAIHIKLDPTDEFWFNYITGEGKTFSGLKVKTITSREEMINLFLPFLQKYGIVAWDKDVGSTANVASTICGINGGVPVMLDEEPDSLWNELKSLGIKADTGLIGKFNNAALGTKISDTQLDSTGSAKCDAYMWAVENLFDKCNPELLAYTPDGAVEYVGNPCSKISSAGVSTTCGIPNHDYFVQKQCFFFDLTSFAGEAPCDDLEQPLGTDAETLKALLRRRYDVTDGKFGMIIGFPPWHLKYTSHVSSDYQLAPPRLEWHFVELVTMYNCGIEADAAHPSWLSNASLYTNYERRVQPKGAPAPNKDIVFDPDTYYFTMAWSGDFDCSPWMKKRMPEIWGHDENQGKIAMTYGYNMNLVDRIPMAFDFVFEHQTDLDIITACEGMGYVFPDSLIKGFSGKEATLEYEYWTRFPGKENHNNTRTLPNGGDKFLEYAKPYSEDLKINMFNRVINGFSAVSNDALRIYNQVATGGSFLQNCTAGPYDVRIVDGVPYVRATEIGGATVEDYARKVRICLKGRKEQFMAFNYTDQGTNVGTPTGMKEFVETFYKLAELEDPDTKYQYVDAVTFMELLKQSGRGDKF